MEPMAPEPRVAAATLRQRLDDLAGALTRLDLDRLLALEGEVAAAVVAVSRVDRSFAADAQVVIELRRARAALERCRRLGRSFEELVRARLEQCGRESGYGRPATLASDLHTFRQSA